MFLRKYLNFTLIILPITALFLGGCATWQRLPGVKSEDARVYVKRCGVCHAVPHPDRLNYNQWKEKIAVMKGNQMPVITAQEKQSVLSYIKDQSKKDLKTYSLRCGQCHDTPDAKLLNSEEWKDLIVTLDGDMPVFSEEERMSVIRYMQAFGKQGHVGLERNTFQALGFEVPEARMETPYFELNSITGKIFSIQDLKDKVSIIHFWATWCKPCREELPTLQSFWDELGDEGIQVLGIVSDRDEKENIKDFILKLGLTFPILFDSGGKMFSPYLVDALPTSYIVGRDGKFLARVVGAMNWSGEELVDYFREISER